MMVNLQDKMKRIHQRCTEKTWEHYETISTSFGARNTGLHQLQYSNSLNETVDIYTKQREGKIRPRLRIDHALYKFNAFTLVNKNQLILTTMRDFI